MARWKVLSKHYIHAEQYGQPTEWERQETNQDTGRMFRKAYKVPMLIDPDDPYCVNKFEGFCVVARKGSERPGDIVFFGPPTMEMEPLDDDARVESEAERPHWKNPIEGLEPTIGEEFGTKLLEMFQRQFDAASIQKPTSVKGASPSDIAELRQLIELQQKQIAKLLGQDKEPDPVPVDDFVPQPDVKLTDVDPNALPKAPPIRANVPPRGIARRM